MRSRTLLFIALVVLLGAIVAVPTALAAAPSEVKLEVNRNCNGFSEWPCWTQPGGSPTYAQSITIASGGTLKFADETMPVTTETDVVWTAGMPSSCTGVPSTPTSGWKGSCEFKQSGTYRFESANLFIGTGYYANDNYTKYEVVVAGPPTPTATTQRATGVTETEATLNGSVNPEGLATSYYFEYGATESYGTKTGEVSAGSGSTSQEFHFTWTGLSPNTTYYFQLVAVYGAGKTKVEGGQMTFKTAAPPSAPMASTQPATGVGETEATLKGTVNPDGEATKYFFEYGTETSSGQKTEEVTLSASESDQAVAATVKGLAPGTEYHFRLVAENKRGSGEGVDSSFKTMSTPVKEPTKEPPAKEPSPTPSTTTISQATSTTPAQSTTTQSEKAIKPLTRAQKLAKALKQCKRQPKKKRAKCEATAKKLYGPKHKNLKK